MRRTIGRAFAGISMPTYSYTSSAQTFTVTNTGTYDITAYGAAGGGSHDPTSFSPVPGGLGTYISGDFYLKAGATLTIVVGEQGGNSTYFGGGGGGGTFVIENYNSARTVLEIAGGGGGAYQDNPGGDSQTGPYGGDGGGSIGGSGGAHGSGGIAGGIGGSGSGGGGGYSGGSIVSGVAAGGGAYGTGYAGGGGYASAFGGFGGGGGGNRGGGGGGGGYSGGGGGGVDEGGSDGGVGGGGGSYFGAGGTNESLATQNTGNGSVTLDLVCYLRGTHILTPSGGVLVEELAIGDAVVTRFAGIQKIKWIGHQHVADRSGQDDRRHAPVHIRPDALGDRQPMRDLFISPGHSMLVDGRLLLGRVLINGVTITQDRGPDEVHYVHLELDRHDCVLAEGAWSETFADAPGLRGAFQNAADFATRYPDQPPCPDLQLCAPRPDDGDALDLALRPVVMRADAALTPGPLRGFIDHIGAPWTIEGWAQDTKHPELPVLLEALLEDRVIGTALACNHRFDLQQAAIGHGRHGFRLTSMAELRPGSLDTLRIRRVADQAEIPQTANCMAQFTADWFAAAVSRLQQAA